MSQFADSATNAQLRYNLENIKLAQAYENVTRNNKNGVYNSIKIDARFPNAKGYSIGDAASYFALDMLAKEKFIDFDLSFYDAAIIDKIYCLSLKIIRIEKEERVCVLDENYTPNKHTNKIRISNTLPKGAYQIEVGFILNNDRNEVYPRFYRAYKSYIKN